MGIGMNAVYDASKHSSTTEAATEAAATNVTKRD